MIAAVKAGSSKRTYDDACGAAHALDLVGERWALLVMRELMLGPKRFTDLKSDLPGISANVLQQRLEGLERSGIVIHRELPPPHSAMVYELTPWGYESEPIFQVLGRWAARSPLHDPMLPISTVSVLLSFRTMFDAQRAGSMAAVIGLRIAHEAFTATIANRTITVVRGESAKPDVTVTASGAAILAAVVYGGQPLTALEQAGALTISGNRRIAEKFVRLFPLPEKLQL